MLLTILILTFILISLYSMIKVSADCSREEEYKKEREHLCDEESESNE